AASRIPSRAALRSPQDRLEGRERKTARPVEPRQRGRPSKTRADSIRARARRLSQCLPAVEQFDRRRRAASGSIHRQKITPCMSLVRCELEVAALDRATPVKSTLDVLAGTLSLLSLFCGAGPR